MKTVDSIQEKMKDVKLSDETKQYLIACKVAEKASNIAYNQVEKKWGNEDVEMMQPVHDALEKFQDEMLKLMMKEIKGNLNKGHWNEI